MEVINSGMRKGIKMMCVVAQTAQFISLMPKPRDFVTRVVGDVVYLSAQIQKLSDDMNKLLDSYADIPANYLMTQMNSITGSLSGITNRLNTITQEGINETMGLAENAVDMASALTGTIIDTTGVTSGAVSSLGFAVAQTGSLGNRNTAEDIQDTCDVYLEWSGNGFKESGSSATGSMNETRKKLTDKKVNVMTNVQGVANTVNTALSDSQKWVEDLITDLRKKMSKLSNIVDSGFKDVTGLDSVSKGSQKISEELVYEGGNKKTTEITTAVTASLATVINNFSIGKVVAAFAGVLTQSVIVRVGLDKLPPIDFESMMYKIRSDMEMSPEDMYKQYSALTDAAYRDLDELSKIPEEERNYSDENYQEFLREYEDDLKKQREEIRLFMKRTDIDNKVAQDTLSKREMRTAIKEVKKYRNKIKNAKQSKKLKDIVVEELDRFKEEAGYRSNSIKSDWNSMMKQYKDCITEIKEFFQNGGSCDMFIDDCCKAINKDFNDIKELCKNIGSQLISSSIKVVMPADIGSVFPNPGYKIADFIMDIKTIIKFIKDIITLVIDILNNINKIARLMINGINNMNVIIQDLMKIVGLRWLMDLIQEIIDVFSENIKDANVRLTNMLSPVYFRDTEEYENTMDALDSYLENKKLTDEETSYLTDVTGSLEKMGITHFSSKIGNVKNIGTISEEDKEAAESASEQIQSLIDELDDWGDTIVAYKSPIIKDIGEEKSLSTSDIMDGKTMDNDLKFIGWHFFHPNLDHTGNDYYSSKLDILFPISAILKKIKSKIIKKASKKSHKKRGGVNMLHSKRVGTVLTKIDEAYTAFYWYTYYTEDLEKDCFEGMTSDNTSFVDNVMRTENGSIVQVTDINGQTLKVFVANSNVRSGDYVTVNGVKYRVK